METMKKTTFVIILALAAPAGATVQERADDFLRAYSAYYQGLYAVTQEADWAASTDVTPEHDGARVAANKAVASFTGNPLAIEKTRELLKHEDELDDSSMRQLRRVWLAAAENPGDIPETVSKRVVAESRQSSAMDSFEFCVERSTDGKACAKPVTANEIDEVLQSTSASLEVKRRYWTAAKEIGVGLKPGLVELRGLRDEVARHFGYKDYFDLQVASYGMSTEEMSSMLDGLLKDVEPLYKQLHCYTKYELAKRYHEPVPKGLIPAHWLGNRWSQEWPGIVQGVDLDPLFKDKSPEWIVKQAEAFYVSMGFDKLPEAFWKKSDLYPVPKGSSRKKNTHASAWHMDLDRDVRSLMSVEPNSEWFTTAHHELGHIYYFRSYSRPGVPLLLRDGANRAFHEGTGDLIAIAANQEPYLREIGVLPKDQKIDRNRWLLDQALTQTIVFLPWSAGVMSHWERDVYAKDLPASEWNKRWWDYVAKFQGVEPPGPRDAESCDACTKTHINDNPAYYYTYAIGTVYKYQVHDYICRAILHQDPRSCNYYGHKEVGDFLKSILEKGATEDWRKLLREKTGSDLTTKPMMDYFAPLMDYLKAENAGRQCSW